MNKKFQHLLKPLLLLKLKLINWVSRLLERKFRLVCPKCGTVRVIHRWIKK